MIVPQLGLYSLNGDLPVEKLDSTFESKTVAVSHAPALGLRIEREFKWPLFSLRPWLAGDYAAVKFGPAKTKNVSSKRFGLDLFAEGPPIFSAKITYLVFGTYEDFSISADDMFYDTKDSDLQFGLSAMFVGGGIGIAF